MTIDEVKQFYGTSYRFQKKTGMNHSNYLNWTKKGFVPIKTQFKLEKMTGGVLKASLDHIVRDE